MKYRILSPNVEVTDTGDQAGEGATTQGATKATQIGRSGERPAKCPRSIESISAQVGSLHTSITGGAVDAITVASRCEHHQDNPIDFPSSMEYNPHVHAYEL